LTRLFVVINGVKGNLQSVDYGVVQGSTLGPLLFLIYINNLVKLDIEGKFYLFADDTLVLFEGKTWETVFPNAERAIAKIKHWFDQNVLTLNIGKTKFMPISLRDCGDTLNDELKIHSCGTVMNNQCNCPAIARVREYKYLGVVIDSKLSWADHVSYLNKKLRKCIFAFYQLRQILDVKETRIAYFSYVQSLIEGGIIAWGGAYRTILQPIMVTQKAIIKAALGRGRRYPSDALFTEMHVLDIRQLFIRILAMHIFKHFGTLFERPVHEYRTRHALDLGIRLPRLIRTFSSTNCYYLAHILYNNLPQNLRHFNNYSVTVYKKQVVRWLIDIGRDRTNRILVSTYRL
jgi:hypothetical protein